MEATMMVVALFNIGLTMVEPGGAGPAFKGGAKGGRKIDAYDISPASNVLAVRPAAAPGDPTKIAAAIINSVEQNPAPKRLALGSDSYGAIHKALSERLAALEAQKDLAHTTDFVPSA